MVGMPSFIDWRWWGIVATVSVAAAVVGFLLGMWLGS